MLMRTLSALTLVAALAACGGNPFAPDPEVPVPVNPNPPPDVPEDFIPEDAVSGSVESVALAGWTPGAQTIRVAMDAQVLPGVAGDFTRNAAFDVVDGGVTYYGYSYQASGENRKAVVLVRGSGGVKAAIAMEPGQFANGAPDMYHAGGALYRADVFRRPTGGGLFNYRGTYAGLLNVGPAAGVGPGSLAPTEPYRTTGTALITADFTRMKLSGGVTGRQVVGAPGHPGVPNDLPDLALWTTGIAANGDFSGIVYYGDDAPAADPLNQNWSAGGRYDGIFSGAGSDVAVIMLFNPIGGNSVWEQGMIVAGCTYSSDSSCP
ncbi:hypothetical protein MASR1M32_16890 [Rhodobacter sp.]